MKRFTLLSGVLTLLAVLLLASLTGSVSSAESHSFPFQAGFPRTELRGVEFSSPTVVDLNQDGQLEVLVGDGTGCVWGWDRRGNLLPGFPWQTAGRCSSNPRIGGPLAAGDVDGDGTIEIIAGTRGAGETAGQRGKVFVWRADGSRKSRWPQEMEWDERYGAGGAEVVSVALANVTGDERLEVLAGTTNNTSAGGRAERDIPRNLYAWRESGSRLTGYPTWYKTAGIYGFIGAADLTGDGYAEVITGRDHLYLHAYDAEGRQLPGWPVQTYVDPARDTWGRHLYMEFTNNAPAMADLDGDGTLEIVVAGKVKDPRENYSATRSGVLVVEPDGQRRAGWTVARLAGGPLYEGFYPSQAPALADLDGNGTIEIVVALYDGTIRAYRENGEELWRYDYAGGRKLYGSEPVIGDINGDQRLDIIFGTYTPDGSANSRVAVHGLDASGNRLDGFPLSLPLESGHSSQGVRAAPTLADLDGDGDVELLVASRGGNLYVWDLPARYRAEWMPWPTSRQNNLRTGELSRQSSPPPTVPPPTAPPPTTPPATPALISLPGSFEAEDYREGGEGEGYHDTSQGNSGQAYRTDDVDIQRCSDGSDCYNVGWIRQGEWLAYNVRFAQSGSYIFHMRVASPHPGRQFHIELDGQNVSGSIAVPTTGGWDRWQTTSSHPIPVSAGDYTLRLVSDTDGFNLDHVQVDVALALPVIILPGGFEAEDYREGGEGEGYHDTSQGNSGQAYRTDDVDIQRCSDGSDCYNVGWIRQGEWLAYNVRFAQNGSYIFQVRAASPYRGRQFHIELDGQNVSGSIAVPTTGGWDRWQTTSSHPIPVSAGDYTLRLVSDADGFNLNTIEVVRQ